MRRIPRSSPAAQPAPFRGRMARVPAIRPPARLATSSIRWSCERRPGLPRFRECRGGHRRCRETDHETRSFRTQRPCRRAAQTRNARISGLGAACWGHRRRRQRLRRAVRAQGRTRDAGDEICVRTRMRVRVMMCRAERGCYRFEQQSAERLAGGCLARRAEDRRTRRRAPPISSSPKLTAGRSGFLGVCGGQVRLVRCCRAAWAQPLASHVSLRWRAVERCWRAAPELPAVCAARPRK
jgi:hypothetical protein